MNKYQILNNVIIHKGKSCPNCNKPIEHKDYINSHFCCSKCYIAYMKKNDKMIEDLGEDTELQDTLNKSILITESIFYTCKR